MLDDGGINDEALLNAYHRELDLKSKNKMLLKEIENLKQALREHIVKVRKNTFNFHTWELEYVDRYYFNGERKNIEVKYDEELEEPKTGYERFCMEEAGIIKKIDDTEEFYRKMKKSKKEGAIMRDELTYKGRKVSCQS
jgi:hypothetical protein